MGWVRAHSRLAIVLGVCVLAAAGGIIAVLAVAGGGESAAAPATTGEYAPITVSRQKIPTIGGAISSNLDAGVETNLSTMLTQLPGLHHYRITITNTSNLGFINSLQWYPPMGVQIVNVTGSSAGRCAQNGLTGLGGSQFKTVVLYPNIVCKNVNLKPPSCTCTGDGGSMTISFVANRDVGASGVARLISATLVRDPIPSFLQPEATTQTGSASQG